MYNNNNETKKGYQLEGGNGHLRSLREGSLKMMEWGKGGGDSIVSIKKYLK